MQVFPSTNPKTSSPECLYMIYAKS
jgi:hypothetical protein